MFKEQPMAFPGSAKNRPCYMFLEILNIKGHPIALMVQELPRFRWMGGFAYWWSFIGMGLRLKPAQQACLITHKPERPAGCWTLSCLNHLHCKSTGKVVPSKLPPSTTKICWHGCALTTNAIYNVNLLARLSPQLLPFTMNLLARLCPLVYRHLQSNSAGKVVPSTLSPFTV